LNFTRNLGIISQSEQVQLSRSRVAIAGVGGDGGLVAETLARMGVSSFALADPEVFEVENLNRQNGSSVATLGRNKAEVIGEIIRGINPEAQITLYEDGIHEANVTEFVAGCNLVIDETEFTLHHLAVMLARASRSEGIAVVTGFNVAFGCLMTSFQADGMSLETYLGLDESASLEEIAATPVGLDRWIPRLPGYVDDDALMAVIMGTIPAPSVAPGVCLAAGLVATEAFIQLIGRQPPLAAPTVRWFDAYESTLEDVVVAISS